MIFLFQLCNVILKCLCKCRSLCLVSDDSKMIQAKPPLFHLNSPEAPGCLDLFSAWDNTLLMSAERRFLLFQPQLLPATLVFWEEEKFSDVMNFLAVDPLFVRGKIVVILITWLCSDTRCLCRSSRAIFDTWRWHRRSPDWRCSARWAVKSRIAESCGRFVSDSSARMEVRRSVDRRRADARSICRDLRSRRRWDARLLWWIWWMEASRDSRWGTSWEPKEKRKIPLDCVANDIAGYFCIDFSYFGARFWTMSLCECEEAWEKLSKINLNRLRTFLCLENHFPISKKASRCPRIREIFRTRQEERKRTKRKFVSALNPRRPRRVNR